MKSKKLLPIIILAVAVFLIVVYSVVTNIAMKPTITEGEFPFSITYELDGETVTIKDVYKVHYDTSDFYKSGKERIYIGEIGNMGEGNTLYTLKHEENSSCRIELFTQFYPDYMMGDAEYDYFDVFEPLLFYYDSDEIEYTDEETLLAQGVKLISFEYPTPIENSFVFSHISYCSGEVVIPTLLIALLSLIAIIIFVKKEKELQYKIIDKISIILNFIISFTVIPFVTILATFIDIEGGGPDLYYQVLYFIPSVSLLCVATSVALRRKGYGVKSLIAGLIGPAIFAIYLICCSASGLF